MCGAFMVTALVVQSVFSRLLPKPLNVKAYQMYVTTGDTTESD